MVRLSLTLDDAVYAFYKKIADRAELSTAQVLSDALFKLAGELSLESLSNREEK